MRFNKEIFRKSVSTSFNKLTEKGVDQTLAIRFVALLSVLMDQLETMLFAKIERVGLLPYLPNDLNEKVANYLQSVLTDWVGDPAKKDFASLTYDQLELPQACQQFQQNLLTDIPELNLSSIFSQFVLPHVLPHFNIEQMDIDDDRKIVQANDYVIPIYLNEEKLNLLATGCGGYGEKSQYIVTSAIAEYIRQQGLRDEAGHTFHVLTGDNIYPSVHPSDSDEKLERFIKDSKDDNLKVRKTIVALGNHESGACQSEIPFKNPGVNGDIIKGRARRDRAVEFFSSQEHMICPYRYYALQFHVKGQDPSKLFVEMFVIESSLFLDDPEQIKWLKRRIEVSHAKHKILVSHHAVSPTVGKRQFKEDESHRYQATSEESKAIKGNQHARLLKCFKHNHIDPTDFDLQVVAHEHSLGLVSHVDTGDIVFTGGGALRSRSTVKQFLPGQLFPKEGDLSAGKTAGFAGVRICGNRLDVELVGVKQTKDKLLCESLIKVNNIKVKLRARASRMFRHEDMNVQPVLGFFEIKKKVLDKLDSYCPNDAESSNFLGKFFRIRKHKDRASSLILDVRKTSKLEALQSLIDGQYYGFGISPMPVSFQFAKEPNKNSPIKYETPISNKNTGLFFKLIKECWQIVHHYNDSDSPAPDYGDHSSSAGDEEPLLRLRRPYSISE